ncbi:protocatechuate 3,4-dioxygenase, alpha subunit [Albimonas donghaensis]|uniref:Protocatechuate 3,4-dioxygenase, alpha subunit n=1 Tax=Albimonas donghaensis TaxID=356660 RepID=A0A1H2TTF1_9RHOB|nr:protocatechuate 3,4-dioxygenase subunit alpha [Albimonas donghaensis]SDW47047.1 protocatechuate 3,4-dioxygenase, alpha subunit [Albimonas donghaensis]
MSRLRHDLPNDLNGYFKETPSQTAGPYVHIGLTPNFSGIEGVYPEDLGRAVFDPGAQGERVTIRGCVRDGAGTPVRDALVEIWQADAAGLHAGIGEPRGVADGAFGGFGRAAADGDTGEWMFETLRPGRVPFKDGRLMAPHITFWIVARGINIGLHTRMYFPDEASANAEDPVLARIDPPARAETLIAAQEGPGVYRFDIRLQGERETVFFDI